MMRNFVRTNNAFTLVELIVVIAIVGILTAVAVPIFSNSLSASKEKADVASLRVLNSATTIYRVSDTNSDPFETSDDSQYLMTVLVPDYLANAVEPQQQGKAFVWLQEEETWVIEDYENVATPVDAFKFKNGQIQGYDGSAGTDIVIPNEIGDEVVTSIGFNKMSEMNLTSVVLPDTLTEIKGLAFKGNNLESITIPGGVSEISVLAFAWNDLTSVTINEGVEVIGNSAFAYNQLTSITIPNSVKEIKQHAFASYNTDSNPITEIIIGGGVNIDGTAFHRDSKGFIACYENYDTTAGTYALIDGQWVKTKD